MLALAVSALFLASCQSESGDRVAKNQIVVGMYLEPLGFYPLRALDSGSYYAQTLVYEGLVRYGANLEVVPALAKDFEVAADGLTYTFHLRDKLRFSDGTPLTIKDVDASFNLVVSKTSPFKFDYDCIEKVEHPDDHTVIFRLSRISAPLLSRLVELRILPASMTSLPDRGREKLSRVPVGSGPFRLTRWESGLELVFEPNEYYWGDKPKQPLVWRIVPDKTLMAMALRRHELDVAVLDATSWDVIKSGGNAKILLDSFPGTRTIYLGFNTKRKPFDNSLVRRALCQSIDRDQIARSAFKGFALVPRTDVMPGSWAYNEKAQFWPFDLTAAHAELSRAGFKFIGRQWRDQSDKQLAFRILTIRDYQDVAQIVSDDLKKLDVPSEVQVLEYPTLRSRYLQKGDFDAVLFSRSSGPDPECSLVWSAGGVLNYSKFDDPRINQLIKQGLLGTTRSARANYYKEIQSILASEQPWAFLVQPELLLAHWSDIENIKQAHQLMTGLPWDNPLFNAAHWRRLDP